MLCFLEFLPQQGEELDELLPCTKDVRIGGPDTPLQSLSQDNHYGFRRLAGAVKRYAMMLDRAVARPFNLLEISGLNVDWMVPYAQGVRSCLLSVHVSFPSTKGRFFLSLTLRCAVEEGDCHLEGRRLAAPARLQGLMQPRALVCQQEGIASTSTIGRSQKGGQMDDKPTPIEKQSQNATYFSKEQFNTGLCFPLHYLFKVQHPRHALPPGPLPIRGKNMRGPLVEWVEKASFDCLNKLFEISTDKWNYQILLTNRNLLVVVREPKPFIIPILNHLTPKVLVPDEHHVLKDLPLYEVAHATNAKTRGDEDMVANLRADFKKRQCKRLFESIMVVFPPTKKPCMEILCLVLVLAIALAPVGTSHVPDGRSSVGKDACLELGGPSTGLTQLNDDSVECVAFIPPRP
ncbi:hypothetical protein CK203_114187 [Vitis vinifera]|uniref:Uncharacterized protein n=1 Tax=Vitis vinifera TaxID=29760 RepID=A0A438D7D8_VITVI|nr:hypothetical protein CK203_114187 [Vitis vinifera]